MVSDQFYEERLSVRERNKKLLLETATYLAIKEWITCIIATERSTNMPVTESTTSNSAEKVSCIGPTETATCRIEHRNFHFPKWCQSEILLVTIKKLSKRVSTNFKANSFSTPCIT